MKNRNLLLILTMLIVAAFVLSACGGGAPTDEASIQPVEPTEEPVEEPTEEPVVEEPVEEPTEEPVEEPTEEPMAEPCAPAADGPLAGVDPRGQTVVWWHNHDEDARLEFLDKYTAEFNATNECGITVEHLEQGGYNDIRDKVNASIAAGELPASMVVGYQNDQAFYQLNDALVDLNDYIDDPTWGLTADELADFFPAYLAQSMHAAYDNQQLGFPPNRSMEGLIYNKTWLQDLGFDGSPPETPEELREMACAAAEANGDGTGGFIIDTGASTIAAWTFAFGGSILSEDGAGYVYNGPATVDSLTFLKELYDDGCAYLYTEGYPQPPFAARQALFTTSSSSGIPYYLGAVNDMAEETGSEADEFGFGAMPHTTADPVQNIYGGDVMITETTPEEQLAAWLWIKYYTQPEVQADWVRASNYFPTRATTADYLGDYMSENPIWASAVELLQYGIGEPQLISYQTVRDEADKAFNQILEGADIQATLDTLTEMANELQAELSEE